MTTETTNATNAQTTTDLTNITVNRTVSFDSDAYATSSAVKTFHPVYGYVPAPVAFSAQYNGHDPESCGALQLLFDFDVMPMGVLAETFSPRAIKLATGWVAKKKAERVRNGIPMESPESIKRRLAKAIGRSNSRNMVLDKVYYDDGVAVRVQYHIAKEGPRRRHVAEDAK